MLERQTFYPYALIDLSVGILNFSFGFAYQMWIEVEPQKGVITPLGFVCINACGAQSPFFLCHWISTSDFRYKVFYRIFSVLRIFTHTDREETPPFALCCVTNCQSTYNPKHVFDKSISDNYKTFDETFACTFSPHCRHRFLVHGGNCFGCIFLLV